LLAWVDVVASTDFEKATVTVVAVGAEAEVITGPVGDVKPAVEFSAMTFAGDHVSWTVLTVTVYDVVGVIVVTFSKKVVALTADTLLTVRPAME
jgi:hypothetical protein